MGNQHLRNARASGIRPGTFIKARGSGAHATITVEGSDTDGPSVSGIALDAKALDNFIVRLQNIRKHLR